MPAAVLPLQEVKRARASRSASFQPLRDAEKATLYAHLRNTAAKFTSTAVGRTRAAFWAACIPTAQQVIAEEPRSRQAVASSAPDCDSLQAEGSSISIRSRHRQRLEQIGLRQRKVPSDGKCLVSHQKGC